MIKVKLFRKVEKNNMDDFLVSIIIPTYHRSEFIKQSVGSALSQSYYNIEVIVVSDNELNSAEESKTKEVMESFKEYDKVTYLQSVGNHGGCAARNRGLSAAKGLYLNFLDDDDCLLPTKIEKQVRLIQKRNKELAVVGCCAAIKNVDGKIIRIEKPIFGADILFSQLMGNICTTSLNLVNHEVCTQAGGFEYIESSQEHLFFIKIYLVRATFDFVDEILVDINQHNGPRISNNSKKPIGAIKLAKYVERYYVRLSDKQTTELKLAHNYNIIKAYCQVGQPKMAFKEYLKRFRINVFNVGMLKLPLIILKYCAFVEGI